MDTKQIYYSGIYTRESDFKVSKINSEEEIARVLKAVMGFRA